MRLLVGFDGSDGGHDALELARALTLGGDKDTVLVVTARPTGSTPGGSPAAMIIELAESAGIDLIVVGSPHRGAVGRALIGSVAESLLHGSPCPVVVAPRGYAGERHEQFLRIAVGHDGTPEADAALHAAEALALRSNALIDVLTVLAPPAATPGPVGYAPTDPPQPEKILNQAIHSLDDRLGATGRRLDGPPAHMLAGACEDADLLVVGSRGTAQSCGCCWGQSRPG